jgi:hypothetical protein
MRNRRRGNVLITALFMAIFLFFLSVALISQNRMDISLGLSVDHRLKADSAARAGLNWGLRTMRTQPDWAKALQGEKPELESGASFDVEVRARSESSGDPNLLVVTSTGRSGIVSISHWAVVEEIRKTPEGESGSAQLFSRAWNNEQPPQPNNLAMLGSDFQWYDLGPLPAGDTTLEASGGPLFVFAPEGSAQPPPSIIDFLPMFVQGPDGVTTQTQGPMVRIELVPPGRHLLTLKITDGAGEWVDIVDPGVQLGSSNGLAEINEKLEELPVIRMWEDPDDVPDDRPPWDSRNVHLTGRGDRDSGFEVLTVDSELGIWNEETGQYDEVTTAQPFVDALALSKTPSELTLDWETMAKPLVFLEWYSLTGKALSADKQKIRCQGLHTFYGHYPVAGDQTFPDLGTPLYESIVYQRPCVLEYDLKTEKWTRIVDLMEVPSSKDSDPRIHRCPEWKDDMLELDSKGRAFLTVKRQEETELIRFDDDSRYDSLGKVPGDSPRVVVYNDQPYYFSDLKIWSDDMAIPRRTLMGFNGKELDPSTQLGGTVPPVSGFLTESGTETEVQFKPRERIALGLVGNQYDLTTWGTDLIATGFLRREVEDLDLPQRGDYNALGEYPLITPKTAATFFRYNGESWQIWPGGGNDLLNAFDTSASPDELPVPSLTGEKIRLAPFNLAIGSYVDGYPDLRRYSVLAAGKDQPPKIKGFTSD